MYNESLLAYYKLKFPLSNLDVVDGGCCINSSIKNISIHLLNLYQKANGLSIEISNIH